MLLLLHNIKSSVQITLNQSNSGHAVLLSPLEVHSPILLAFRVRSAGIHLRFRLMKVLSSL